MMNDLQLKDWITRQMIQYRHKRIVLVLINSVKGASETERGRLVELLEQFPEDVIT